MIPLKGCQKYGNESLYHIGFIGDVLKKYGTIDLWTEVSMIRRQSITANLEKKFSISIKAHHVRTK